MEKDKNKADLSKVRVEVLWHEDLWQLIKDTTMTTIGFKRGRYPDSEWKKALLLSQHSPIREGRIVVRIIDAPQFVHGHLVRHHVGVTPYISTLRSDRTDYEEVPNRNTLQTGAYSINFQAFLDISRKRCCFCASYETRYVWQKVLEAIKDIEPELYSLCVKECVYRNGICPEVKSCGYNKTKEFEEELKKYTDGFKEQINSETNIHGE